MLVDYQLLFANKLPGQKPRHCDADRFAFDRFYLSFGVFVRQHHFHVLVGLELAPGDEVTARYFITLPFQDLLVGALLDENVGPQVVEHVLDLGVDGRLHVHA